MDADLLRLATAGSVDDGKSTLIGRLLFDSKQVLEDQLAAVERTSKQRGETHVNLALLTDGLRAEREQGITIDVAYRYFATARRKFIIADTPGHRRYTRNMVTGASTADLALILVDARQGVLEQSRRHAFLASLLGISHFVVCVNKMDLVGFDPAVFRQIETDFKAFTAKLDVKDITFIPMSALKGDNVVDRSMNTPWYEGPPLLYHLENVHIASDRNLIDCRFPVQWVVRPSDDAHHDYRGYAGNVASGVIRKGDEIVILPTLARSRVAKIDTFDGEVSQAFPPMSVTLLLEDDIDISRGDMICRPNNVPIASQDFEALVSWMDDRPLVVGNNYVLKHTTRTTRARVQDIRYAIDVNTLSREGAESLKLNDIGRVALRTTTPLFYDEYKKNRETGSFILIDETTNTTVGGGMFLEATVARSTVRPSKPPAPGDGGDPKSLNIVPHRGILSREARFLSLGSRGSTVWLTGLSGSGKSSIGAALEQRIVLMARQAYVLDGDNLRHGLCRDLAFSGEDRKENVRRAAHVAQILADAGSIAIVTLISPFAEGRAAARKISEDAGLPFFEVYVSTSLEECERRDPKGLYKRARAGEITGFTGIDDPYEAPASPDVLLSSTQTVEEAVDVIVAALRAKGALL
jgi:bifunctional enzyme CysN/CysC